MTDDAVILQRKRGTARTSMRAGFGAKKAAQSIEAELKRRKKP